MGQGQRHLELAGARDPCQTGDDGKARDGACLTLRIHRPLFAEDLYLNEVDEGIADDLQDRLAALERAEPIRTR
jgi:hypothetical protein